MTSEYYPVFLFIYLKVILAQSFLRAQGFLMNISIPFLARNFGSNARLLPLATPESYSCTSRISQRQVTQQLTKITAKIQNEPNGMLFKPYSKPKNRLFDNFTKPFYAKRTQWYVIY